MHSPGQISHSRLSTSVADELRHAAECLPAAAEPLRAGTQLLAPLAQATSATRASLLVLNPHTAQLFMLAGLGVPEDLVGQDLPSRPRSIADWVLRHQHGRLFQGDVREDAVEGFARSGGIESSLCLPIVAPSGPIGVVNLARTSPATPFGEDDYAAVLQALPALGVALESLRFRALAERYAHQLGESSARRGRVMLPEGTTDARGWEFAFKRVPGMLQSADFADRLPHADGGQTVLVADVAGDGVDAALTAAFVQGLFVAASVLERSPAAIAARLSSELAARAEREPSAGLWLAEISPNGLMSSCVSGCTPPLWWPEGADGPQPLDAGNDGTPRAGSEERIRLMPGDVVVMASDAVHLSLDPLGRGDARGLMNEVLEATRRLAVDQIASALCDAARERSGRPVTPDDLSVFVLRYRPEA